MSLSFKHILQQIIKKCSSHYIILFYKQESKDKYIPTRHIGIQGSGGTLCSTKIKQPEIS